MTVDLLSQQNLYPCQTNENTLGILNRALNLFDQAAASRNKWGHLRLRLTKIDPYIEKGDAICFYKYLLAAMISAWRQVLFKTDPCVSHLPCVGECERKIIMGPHGRL